MKYIFLIVFFVSGVSCLSAQDTAHRKLLQTASDFDSLKISRPSRKGVGNMAMPERKKIDYFRDTVHRERRKFDSALFTNITALTTSDYAEDLGRVYQILNKIPSTTSSFEKLPAIQDYMDRGDSILDLLKDRMFQSDRTFNIRNLQMFNTLLDELDRNTIGYSKYLAEYDTALDQVRNDISTLQKDTLMLRIFRDTALKNAFQPQLQQLKLKWRQVDSLVTDNSKQINTLKSQASAHSITIGELLYRVDLELKTGGSEAFGKERRYLWEANASDQDYSENSFKESFENELQLAGVYFTFTGNRWLWLPLIGLLLFYWVWWNFRVLQKLNKLEVIRVFNFHYIRPYPILETLIVILALAPLFDLHAPSLYIESIELLSMISLSILIWRLANKMLFYGWCVFMFLFLLLFLTRIMAFPLNIQRWVTFFIDSVSFFIGLYFLSRYKKLGQWISIAIGFYVLVNLLAVLCNLFGRVTLSQIFGYTAVYSFAQAISLAIFVKIIEESFLLQIQTSRTRKAYPEGFEYITISKSIRRFTMLIAIPLWLIVLAINLNLFDSLNDLLLEVFESTRKVGNFSFTIGGIVLFLGIIWLANFLQKYIAYFFGDTGDDAAFDDKGQRSRLMITRLILLIMGFLLAVAASGLAVDRITVILGALGVGIGLGLQSIVNNFVSGVILIFDRPLRIGDMVELGDKKGRVKEIGIRTSTLLTDEGSEVIIPNGDVLSHNIINWSLNSNHIRGVLTFTIDKPPISKNINTDEINNIIQKNNHVLQERKPEVLLNILNSKSINVQIFFWTKDFDKNGAVSSEIKAAVFEYLEKEGYVVS